MGRPRFYTPEQLQQIRHDLAEEVLHEMSESLWLAHIKPYVVREIRALEERHERNRNTHNERSGSQS